MIIRHFEIRQTLLYLGFLSCLLNATSAQETQTDHLWTCVDVLDKQTRASLSVHERFFDTLFQFPAEYERATQEQKDALINQWLAELQGTNYEKATEAAAYLGMVRAKKAARTLEQVITAGEGGGRIRWVCTRSLGQIRDYDSIPLLTKLLDNQNKDTRVYARVALAEITEDHLGEDKESKGAVENKGILQRIGNGVVLRDEPKDAGLPKMNLSKTERLENFDILAEAIDKNYSFFVHKNIDWPEVTKTYRQKIEAATTNSEFYSLIYRFVRELKDAHSWLCNYKQKTELGGFSPHLHTRLIEGKLVATDVLKDFEAYASGLRTGAIITHINGMSVKEKIESNRRLMRMYSSERALLEEACRQILLGPKGSTVSIVFIAPGEKLPKIARLKRSTSLKKEKIIKPNFPVNKNNYIWDSVHPSGFGYIRILSFLGKEEITDGFDRALERLKNTPGLIIDVRENPGGLGVAQPRIIGRLIASHTKVDIVYRKNGPGHEDFSRKEEYFDPTGDWQYTKPIALLTNAITGSASDLFVCRMAGTGRPITVGSTTHGNSTGTCVFVHLPCNLVVRVSAGYICDIHEQIIEANGNIPQIHVEPTIDDVLNGTDSVMEQAIKELQLQSGNGNHINYRR